MASLDLSMAFDMVNTSLLIKRLRVMGMPLDLINLIREWLVGRTFYVQVGDDCSALFDSDVGTIQGSVLGPILYALFVSPLFDLTQVLCQESCEPLDGINLYIAVGNFKTLTEGHELEST